MRLPTIPPSVMASFGLALLTLCLPQLTGSVLALDYVDASPDGPEFPQWDGGDTVLRFADINADGHVDFLTVGDHGSPYINTDQHGIMVYFGDGDAGWSIHMEGNFGYGGIAVGDINNDGLLDVGYGVHHDYSSNDMGDQLMEAALGDGTGTSWTPWDDGLATNGEDYGMFATDLADIDNDGDLDLASNSFGCCNGVHVYRNNGDGTWTQTWASQGGNSDAFLSFGDVNGDGNPDLAASQQHGTIWLGDGAGGFTPADNGLPPAGIIGRAGVSLGDIDGDGCADLSYIRDEGVYVYVWRQDHWEEASIGLPTSGDYDISYLWDMDVDGLMDVVGMADGEITVWLGDGLGHWTEATSYDPAPGRSSHALEVGGDIDHNGFPDIALLQEEGSFPNYRNHLYVLREASTPSERFVVLQFPRGNETFLVGSVKTIRWSAAQVGGDPATIDLDLSVAGPEGPWTPIAAGIPDGGHWQWIVPGPPSDGAHIRVTLRQGEESASATSRAFQIVAGASDVAEDTQSLSLSSVTRLRVFPNPVVGGARFHLEVGLDAPAGNAGYLLSIHDVGGRLVRQLRLAPRGTGMHWDGTNEAGRQLPAGLYLVRLRDASGQAVGGARRITLLR